MGIFGLKRKPKRWYGEQIKLFIDELHGIQLRIDAKEQTLPSEYKAMSELSSAELKKSLSRDKVVNLSDRKYFSVAFEVARLKERREEIVANIAELEKEKDKSPA